MLSKLKTNQIWKVYETDGFKMALTILIILLIRNKGYREESQKIVFTGLITILPIIHTGILPCFEKNNI